jgi:hypothetical protein
METNQQPPPPASLLYTVAKLGGEPVLGGMFLHDIAILRNKRSL